MIRSTFSAFAVGVLGLALLSGCGGGGIAPIPVEGTVTLDGKPLANASVVFLSKQGGRPAIGKTDASGHFQLKTVKANDGAVPGENVVTISVVPDNLYETRTRYVDDAAVDAKMAKLKPVVPVVYSNREKTPLKVMVSKDNRTFKFELKSK